jgi:hypothetical protein
MYIVIGENRSKRYTCLFYDAVSFQDCIVSNGGKGFEKKLLSWPNRYLPDGSEENHEN